MQKRKAAMLKRKQMMKRRKILIMLAAILFCVAIAASVFIAIRAVTNRSGSGEGEKTNVWNTVKDKDVKERFIWH